MPAFQYIVKAPGRVNLLGEHVDYNGGPVLPAAIDRYVSLSFTPRSDRLVNIRAVDLSQSVTFSLDDLNLRTDTHGSPLPAWALYPAGVAWSLAKNGLDLSGMDCQFSSTIPIGAGLSSSAAVEVAFAAAWNYLAGNPLDRTRLAVLCRQAENRYVGVNCGIMDQFASANGVAGHAILLDTGTLKFKPVPLPPDTAIVIADSQELRTLNHTGYNERHAGCEKALAILSAQIQGIHSLRDVNSRQLGEYSHLLEEPIRSYARHVVEECERVDRAVILLNNGDAIGFGRLMYDCHRSLRDLYRVSTPALDTLVEIAARTPGCYGARLTGAGFGGCTVNLVAGETVPDFISAIKTGYLQATGRSASVFPCRASAGVEVSATIP